MEKDNLDPAMMEKLMEATEKNNKGTKGSTEFDTDMYIPKQWVNAKG